ncbi:MAG: NUDIX domain-containing protein [Lachnospiraceae bacterium]|nr:NUDIX domain-containing protein [Lachnospiraceae bacterium]
MAKDIAIHMEKDWFRYRTGAFVEHDGKYLFIKSNFGDYDYMMGGAVHMGETSAECIEREVYEESGIKAKAVLLCAVVENFFDGKGGDIEGKDCHVLEYYYLMSVEDFGSAREITDDGEKLVWLSVEEIKKSNIKPSFIPERIDEILTTKHTIHIIEDRDCSKRK